MDKQTLRQTFTLIKSDLQARCDYENKQLTLLRFVRFFFFSGTVCVIWFRIAKFFADHHMGWLADLIGLLNHVIHNTYIHTSSSIGPRLIILHANGIHIGPYVTIGSNCILAHQNAITPDPFIKPSELNRGMAPDVGNYLMMGGGACIYGNVKLGDHVKVSMNAVVNESHPNNAVLFGVPAKNKLMTAAG